MSEENLEEILDKLYNLDSLIKLYKEYLSPFDKKGSIKLDQKSIDFSSQKAQKKELVNILANIYTNREQFQELLKNLPNDVIKIFKLLVWEGGKYRTEELEKELELSIIQTSTTSSKVIPVNIHFLFFGFEKNNTFSLNTNDYKIFLPNLIRNTLKEYFEAPEYYYLKKVESMEIIDYINEDKSNILNYLPLYCNYVNSNNINYSKQDKPSKASVKAMKEYFGIKEFYDHEDKEVEQLKTELFAVFFKDLNVSVYKNSTEMLKSLVDNFDNLKSNYFLDTLISHIKGKGDIRNNPDYIERNKKVKSSFVELIKSLPNEWISVENIIKYCFYRNLFFDLFDPTFAESNLYFDETKKASNSYSYGQKSYIKEELYNDLIKAPLIKGLMFLFSALGIVDIAYNMPKNNVYRQKNQEYLSVFDELKYVKLSSLGEYILGLKEDFNYEIVTTETINIELDEELLLIKLSGNDKYKILFIESLSEKISDNTYKVTFSSFLNGCNTKEDLENKISTFKNELNLTLPTIWNTFFNKLIDNTKSIIRKNDIEIYKIDSSDLDLLNLLSLDDVLRKNILKAEKSYIAVSQNNIPIVRKRLNEFGYFI